MAGERPVFLKPPPCFPQWRSFPDSGALGLVQLFDPGNEVFRRGALTGDLLLDLGERFLNFLVDRSALVTGKVHAQNIAHPAF